MGCDIFERRWINTKLAERDATIAQQAAEIERLTVERDEARRTVRMAHEEGTKLSEQRAALAERSEKMRKALKTVVDDAEECTDHDGWTAMLLSLDAYHIASACLDEINALPDLASGALPNWKEVKLCPSLRSTGNARFVAKTLD